MSVIYKSLILLLAWFAYLHCCFADAAVSVQVASRGDENAKYAISMIRLGMEKIGKPLDLKIKEAAMSAPKLREELIAGEIDVIWTATSIDMEENALPVRVPLFKGLLGHRILIIHKKNSHLFDNVLTMDDVRKFRYGQGMGWSDTTIMKANDMTVVEAIKYEGLFHMADGGRFDAFPRGVHEPWEEMNQRPDLELTVDTNVMLVYISPYYLVVSPKRQELAADLEKGLLMAIDDGSFDKLFYENSMVKMVKEKANLTNRKIFKLKNPDLPPKTPIDNPKLWVDISQF